MWSKKRLEDLGPYSSFVTNEPNPCGIARLGQSQAIVLKLWEREFVVSHGVHRVSQMGSHSTCSTIPEILPIVLARWARPIWGLTGFFRCRNLGTWL
jgi:hypothetical protein